MSPRRSSASGDTIMMRRRTVLPPWELQGLLRTWPGLAARISPALTLQLCSSTWPPRWTIRTTSNAPHGRTQAKQHLRLLPIINQLSGRQTHVDGIVKVSALSIHLKSLFSFRYCSLTFPVQPVQFLLRLFRSGSYSGCQSGSFVVLYNEFIGHANHACEHSWIFLSCAVLNSYLNFRLICLKMRSNYCA